MDDAAEEVDIDQVLKHLSPNKRRKFLASVRASAEGEAGGGRDRERSPRPNSKKEREEDAALRSDSGACGKFHLW